MNTNNSLRGKREDLPLKMTPAIGSGSPSVFFGIPLADSTTTFNMLLNVVNYRCTEDIDLIDKVHHQEQQH